MVGTVSLILDHDEGMIYDDSLMYFGAVAQLLVSSKLDPEKFT